MGKRLLQFFLEDLGQGIKWGVKSAFIPWREHREQYFYKLNTGRAQIYPAERVTREIVRWGIWISLVASPFIIYPCN